MRRFLLSGVSGEVRLRSEHDRIETSCQPTRWTFVLDVSSSMSANFAGQCNIGPGSPPR
jgi:hypothetical protein